MTAVIKALVIHIYLYIYTSPRVWTDFLGPSFPFPVWLMTGVGGKGSPLRTVINAADSQASAQHHPRHDRHVFLRKRFHNYIAEKGRAWFEEEGARKEINSVLQTMISLFNYRTLQKNRAVQE